MLKHHWKGMNLHEHQNYMVKDFWQFRPINSIYTSSRAYWHTLHRGLEGIRPHSSNRSAPVGLCRWFHPLRSFPHRSHRCQSSDVPGDGRDVEKGATINGSYNWDEWDENEIIWVYDIIRMNGMNNAHIPGACPCFFPFNHSPCRDEVEMLRWQVTWIIIVWEYAQSAKLRPSSPSCGSWAQPPLRCIILNWCLEIRKRTATLIWRSEIHMENPYRKNIPNISPSAGF